MPLEKLKKADEKVSEVTWKIIFFVSKNITKILRNIPKEKLTKFLDENSKKISEIIEKFVEEKWLENIDENPENSEKLKKIYGQIKKYKAKNKEYWKYFDELDEKEKSIERFKLMLFSILVIPWWATIVAIIIWNPLFILYINWALLLPSSKLPKPVSDTREKVFEVTKGSYKVVKGKIFK